MLEDLIDMFDMPITVVTHSNDLKMAILRGRDGQLREISTKNFTDTVMVLMDLGALKPGPIKTAPVRYEKKPGA